MDKYIRFVIIIIIIIIIILNVFPSPHSEELNALYCSPNIARVIKSRRMRWAGHVARMGEMRGFWWGNLGERDHLGELGLDWRIILR
jgi:hypothetical protein